MLRGGVFVWAGLLGAWSVEERGQSEEWREIGGVGLQKGGA